MSRCLRRLLTLVSIAVIPLALSFLYWWLRTRAEPEPTLMGTAPVKRASAIEIPPEALAAQRQAECVPVASLATKMSAPTSDRVVTPVIAADTPVADVVATSFAVVVVDTPPEVTTETPTEPAPPDDLRRLEGIGPKVAGLLEAAGIITFAQLAETDVAHLREILDAAKLRFLDPTTWPEQAALAAKGDWAAFEKLTSELKGGRRVS